MGYILMQRQRVAAGLVVLALLASAALMHAREINPIVQTVGVSAVMRGVPGGPSPKLGTG